jgi:hypothetical protein
LPPSAPAALVADIAAKMGANLRDFMARGATRSSNPRIQRIEDLERRHAAFMDSYMLMHGLELRFLLGHPSGPTIAAICAYEVP